jgi:hypothetical protein
MISRIRIKSITMTFNLFSLLSLIELDSNTLSITLLITSQDAYALEMLGITAEIKISNATSYLKKPKKSLCRS